MVILSMVHKCAARNERDLRLGMSLVVIPNTQAIDVLRGNGVYTDRTFDSASNGHAAARCAVADSEEA